MIELLPDNILVSNYGLNYKMQDFLYVFLGEGCSQVNIFIGTKPYTFNSIGNTIK